MCAVYWNIAQCGLPKLSSRDLPRENAKTGQRLADRWVCCYFFFMPIIMCRWRPAFLISIWAQKLAALLRGYRPKSSQTVTDTDFSRTFNPDDQKPFPSCQCSDFTERNPAHIRPWSRIQSDLGMTSREKNKAAFLFLLAFLQFLNLFFHRSPSLPSPLPEVANKMNTLAISPCT